MKTTTKKKKLTPEQINKIAEQRNENFKKLSASGKRVAVAKDVISQINLGIFKPSNGVFINESDFYNDNLWDFELEQAKKEKKHSKINCW